MPDIERRTFALDGVTVEKRADAAPVLRGHAAVFDSLSEDLGGFREKIAPGAFADAIQTDDVRALLNHDPNILLGRNRSKTLRLAEDQKGLAIEIDLPDTQAARDLSVLIARGDLTQMSFGFSVRPGGQEWAKDDNGAAIRTLKKVRLFDVSPVTFPAYAATDVAVREWRAWSTSTNARPVLRNLMKSLNLQAQIE